MLAGLLLRRTAPHTSLALWVFTFAAVAFVAWLLFVFAKEPIPSNLAYVIIAIVTFGPASFTWRPYLVGITAMSGSLAWALIASGIPRSADWLVASATAVVVSALLLELRLRLLKELADAEHASTLQSRHDGLTSLLNRRGLEERLPQMWADATRRKEPVTVCFFDVRGLKRANDEHGHGFGDSVIRATAAALEASVRGGDLLARWGGDEFVCVSVGSGLSADAMAARVNGHLEEAGRAWPPDWIGDISVGLATAEAADVEFHDLLQLADEEMYKRRAHG